MAALSERAMKTGSMRMEPELEQRFGFVHVCLDPYVNGLHVSLLRRRKNPHHSREYFVYLLIKGTQHTSH